MSNEKAVTADALKAVLKHGKNGGQSAETLAFLLNTTPRAIRTLVDELIESGTPVCAHPSTGYYIATSIAEVYETCDFLAVRIQHGLNKMKKLHAAFCRASGLESSGELQQYENDFRLQREFGALWTHPTTGGSEEQRAAI